MLSLAQADQKVDQAIRLGNRIGTEHRLAIARLEARFARIRVQSDDGNAGSPETSHRGEAGVEQAAHERGRPRPGRSPSNLDGVINGWCRVEEVRQSTHRGDPQVITPARYVLEHAGKDLVHIPWIGFRMKPQTAHQTAFDGHVDRVLNQSRVVARGAASVWPIEADATVE